MKPETKKRIDQLNNGEIPDGYKKTKFGIFPCDWATIRIGDVSITNGKYGINAPACEQTGNLPKYLRITDIDENGRYSDNGAFVDDKDSINYLLKKNDIVFARTGASVGKSYLYNENDGVLAYAGFLIKFSIDPNKCNPYLLKANCTTTIYDKWVSIMSARSGQPGINAEEYASYAFVAPKSVTEQKKIAEVLMKWDEAIELYQQQIEKLSKLKRAALANLFPQKGQTTPKYRFAGFTDPWEQRKFSDLVLIERGGSPRPIDDYVTDAPDGLNWVKIGDAPAQGRYITKTAEKIKPEGLSKTRQVQPGDLILSNSMSFGKPYIMGINGCIHDGWLLIRDTQNRFDLKFLCHMLGTDQMLNQYRMFAAGSTVNNLNKELVGNTTVSLPSVEEQRVIGEYLESIDNLITLHQRKVDTVAKQRAVLQQYLLNGIVRV